MLQGTKTFLLADDDGQIQLTHSVSAGLDYAAVGPEHAYLRDQGRIDYDYATDDEALDAFSKLSRAAKASSPRSNHRTPSRTCSKSRRKCRPTRSSSSNLSGRGDKDVAQAAEHLLK